MSSRLKFEVGMKVRLRKAHPCGGYDWEIVRLGADVGIVCAMCGRRVMLEREEFERRVKLILPSSEEKGEEA